MATQQPPEDNVPHPADRKPPAPPVPREPPSNLPVARGETSSSAIAARERASVEARFLTAMHRPRNFEAARLRLLAACERPAFAQGARYSKPVGNERVTGFTIRFAEEARVLWGNVDVTALVVFDDDDRRIYRVQGTDLETNATEGIDVLIEKFVERKNPQKGSEIIGQRLNSKQELVYRIRATEDDLLVKVNAVISKYRRNVILTLIPADVKEDCEAQIIRTISDRDAEDPAAARKDITEAFFKLGVDPTELVRVLGKPIEQINPAELTLLRSYYTALKEGEATWADIAESHIAAHGKTGNGDEAKPAAARQTKGAAGLKDAMKKPAATATVTTTDAEDLAEDRRILDAEKKA